MYLCYFQPPTWHVVIGSYTIGTEIVSLNIYNNIYVMKLVIQNEKCSIMTIQTDSVFLAIQSSQNITLAACMVVIVVQRTPRRFLLKCCGFKPHMGNHYAIHKLLFWLFMFVSQVNPPQNKNGYVSNASVIFLK